MKRPFRMVSSLILLLLAGTGWSVMSGWLQAAEAVDYVWLEGETPAHTPTELKNTEGREKVHGGGRGWAAEGWGDVGIISEGKLLHVNLSSAEVEKYVPEAGLIFGYDFATAKQARQKIWARIGYEWVRSDFSWRLDGGEWHASCNKEPTTNIMPMQIWNELAWLRLGEADLPAGKHTVEFRLLPQKIKVKDKETTDRMLMMLDSVCLTPAEFRPFGKWKPGADYRTEADRAAASKVFTLADKPGTDGRAWTELNGDWEYAGWDETVFPIAEETRTQPVKELPDLTKVYWQACKVPGRREEVLPRETFTHRYLMRCRVSVPADAVGKGFFLDVQRSSLVVSVFVNGVFAGATDVFHTAWQMDLSRFLKAGETNELILCIKDAYYALNPAFSAVEEKDCRRFFNLPLGFLSGSQGTAGMMDYPLAADPNSGLMEPVSLVVCGPVYAQDVFVKPGLKKKELGAEVTLLNPSASEVGVTLRGRVLPWNGGKGGAAELTLPEQNVLLKVGECKTLSLRQTWEKPHLWWPDDPYLYWLETEVVRDGKVVDTKRTRFGFREWDWQSDMFRLNGVKWPLWADLACINLSPQKQMETVRRSGQNHQRLWTARGLGGMTRREVLNYFDESGLLIRSSGTFDGQMANYGGGLRMPDKTQKPDKNGRYPLTAKQPLWSNWQKQLLAWVKEERNHPAVYIWSLENEITYINLCNLGQLKECEPEISRGAQMVMQEDPTRPVMVDGGNALADGSLPVNGAHYTEKANQAFRDFPDAAYDKELYYTTGNFRAWPFIRSKPIMSGEVYFANGYSTADFATFGGPECYIGVGETAPARDLFAKILSEGWRWQGMAAWQFWMGGSDTPEHNYWNSWKPVAALCRQWNWSMPEKQTIRRDLRIFNNTRYDDPLTVRWALELNDKKTVGEEKEFQVAPGETADWTVSFALPEVPARTAGAFTLEIMRGGKTVFTDRKELAVLAEEDCAKPEIAAGRLAVYDPANKVQGWLKAHSIAFTPVAKYGEFPAAAELLLIGPDALQPAQSTDNLLLTLAARGKRVVVLDQQYPLAYSGISADLQPTADSGRIAFPEDYTHPALKSLKREDFFTWGADHVVYRNAYKKGTRGGRSLVQCDQGLGYAALFESRVNEGLLLLSQLAIGEKLGKAPAADQMLGNLLAYVAAYTPVKRGVSLQMPVNDPRTKLLSEIGIGAKNESDPLTALMDNTVAVVDATPENLQKLVAARDKVDFFCKKGNWLMLWGLTPEGLADFNKLVGCNHVLRPFSNERVLLNIPADPLMSGLTMREVVMTSAKRIWSFRSDCWFSDQVFSYIPDNTDIAPFCALPTPQELGKNEQEAASLDHNPRNLVNGFTADDGWIYTYTTNLTSGNSPKIRLKLPKEEELVSLKIRPSKLYNPLTQMKIYFDQDPNPVTAEIPVSDNPTTVDVPVPGRKAKEITLELAKWESKSDKDIVVIDNLALQVKRDPEYLARVHSLLNIGGLMRYDIGSGGILLNQLKVMDAEENPENAKKKSGIVKTLLANTGVRFQGDAVTVRRERYRYAPVEIAGDKFSAYASLDKTPGWYTAGLRFMEGKTVPGADMTGLPVGEQEFGGVQYNLADFRTSPVPSVLMLSGSDAPAKLPKQIADLPVKRKAERVCFLHTYNASNGLADWLRKAEDAKRKGKTMQPYKTATYVVDYEGGKSEKIDIHYGEEVGSWDDPQPQPLPGAALAWSGKSKNGQPVSVWSLAWRNPHPELVIKSVTLQSNPSAGSVSVFAVSTADMVQ